MLLLFFNTLINVYVTFGFYIIYFLSWLIIIIRCLYFFNFYVSVSLGIVGN